MIDHLQSKLRSNLYHLFGLFILAILTLVLTGCGKSDSSADKGAASSPPANSGGTVATQSPAPSDAMSVLPGPNGVLAVAKPDGSPADGIKLSQYDKTILPPRIAVGSDGIIHVAFVETMAASPYTQFVYHRQSGDGGKTWSDPKNLSEDMPNIGVGSCKLLIDGNNRTYVIWRTGWDAYTSGAQQDAEVRYNNLYYRCLSDGKWSKIIPVHKPITSQTQDDGSIGLMAVVDGAGKAQVFYNVLPNHFHPDQALGPNSSSLASIKAGLIFQATLDGESPPQPREWYMAPIKVDPNNPQWSRSCDGFSALEGFVTTDGKPHLMVQMYDLSTPNTQLQFIEDGKQTPSISLPPDAYGSLASNPPRLLVDASGKRHIIAKYDAGERHAIRDYLVGSEDDPTIVLAAKPAPGTIRGFQAFQGPSGKMAVLVQATDSVTSGDGDTFLVTNDGNGKWSAPICLTNNAGRAQWAGKQTGALGGVITSTRYGPDSGAVTWDKEGHLLIALINDQVGSFGLSAGGVVYTSGSSSSPMLFFMKI